MKNYKVLVIGVLLFSMLLGTTMVNAAEVTPSKYTLKEGVSINQTTAKEGYLAGFLDGTVRPNDKVTKEQFAVMIARCFNTTGPNTGDKYFTDLDGSWSSADLNRLYESGILENPRYHSAFEPKKAMTREEALWMLTNIVDVSNYAVTHDLADISVEWVDGHDLYAKAYNAKLIAGFNLTVKGVTKKVLGVDGTLTRAEAVTFINRIIYSDMSTTKVNKYKDNKVGAWYYNAIIKSSK